MFPPSSIFSPQSCDVLSISGADKALGISCDLSAANGTRKKTKSFLLSTIRASMTDDSTVSRAHNGRCCEKSIALRESIKIEKYLLSMALKQLRDDYNWSLDQGIVKNKNWISVAKY